MTTLAAKKTLPLPLVVAKLQNVILKLTPSPMKIQNRFREYTPIRTRANQSTPSVREYRTSRQTTYKTRDSLTIFLLQKEPLQFQENGRESLEQNTIFSREQKSRQFSPNEPKIASVKNR